MPDALIEMTFISKINFNVSEEYRYSCKFKVIFLFNFILSVEFGQA